MLTSYLRSSIGKKQIVALTGLMLIGFVVFHLLGNLLIYIGPSAFNAYAQKLSDLRPALTLLEIVLTLVFIIHMTVTALLVCDNWKARGTTRYAHAPATAQTWASRSMRFTGPIVLVYVIMHLFDYTWANHHGASSLVNGEDLGLYGLVTNSFASLPHSLWYIVAMIAVGLHLDHGVQSFFQTFGLSHRGYMASIKKISRVFAVVITIGYSSIPLFILISRRLV